MKLSRTIIVAAILMMPSIARGHDKLANGEPVPEWIGRQCCSVSDAHHLDPSQVHVVPGGYRIDDLPASKIWLAGPEPQDRIVDRTIPERRVLPSPDGEWWIFYGDISPEYVFCVFGPIGAV